MVQWLFLILIYDFAIVKVCPTDENIRQRFVLEFCLVIPV